MLELLYKMPLSFSNLLYCNSFGGLRNLIARRYADHFSKVGLRTAQFGARYGTMEPQFEF